MHASSLDEKIWQVVAAIPPGKVASYGQVARLCGYPSHARYVGRTMANLPRGSKLPWFRVLRSNGTLAFPAASAHWKKQRKLLLAEGIDLREDKVPMRQFQWDA